jgi:hypothetical protein
VLIKVNLFKKVSILFLAILFSGCAALHSVSMTSFPKDRQKPVEAKVSKFVFLAFNFNNDFIYDLTSKLQEQCPNGKVTGITSKYETRGYLIGYTMIVTSQGFCTK